MSLEPSAVETFGDRCVLVRFDAAPSRELTEQLVGISVAAARLPEVIDAAPGITCVLIELTAPNPSFIDGSLPGLLEAAIPLQGTVHEVAVYYDGEDLEWVLQHLNLSAKDLIAHHCAPIYDVRLLGSPGFIYLSNVVPEIAVPRMETPRRFVAAGSVGIGGQQAGIYGRARPGGWRIIATTADLPQMRPGDRVKFVP